MERECNQDNVEVASRLDLRRMTTELRNKKTVDIDKVATLDMVRMMNREDIQIPLIVATQVEYIAAAIDAIAERMLKSGRLIYIGAGTSGRLGILDASECPPTFNTPPGMVMALIAGGEEAISCAVEGAEDATGACSDELQALGLNVQDSVVGLSASGRTPYVLDGLSAARVCGALTVGVVCNDPAPISEVVDIAIHPVVGPEVITGSTRLKAGTAQKMILNMISTGVMVRIGKTYGNLMVDMQYTNEKLRERAVHVVCQACEISDQRAARLLESCDGQVKTAIVCHLTGLAPDEARNVLSRANGVISTVLKEDSVQD